MVIILGPSSSGKTNLAIKVAKQVGTNILSADSRQIYTGLDYSTGKLPINYSYTKNNGFWDIEGIRYYGYDIINPNKEFSAGDFVDFASKTKNEYRIICGGTGLYISALMGKTSLNKTAKNIKLREKLGTKSAEELLRQLEKLGYNTQDLNNSEKNNKQRLIRKIEIFTTEKEDKHFIKDKNKGLPLTGVAPIIGLYTNDYDKKIQNWIDSNFENIKVEVENLIKKYPNSPVLNGFIFSEMQQFITGDITIDKAKELIYYSYRQFIKRQMTYFKKHFNETTWFNDPSNAEKHILTLFK